jgi:glyoxylase-like metal-dependent hydrolase (beta-lactamase superfamily II)
MAVALTCASLGTSAVLAAAPMAKTPAPGYFRIMLGDFEVTALSDGTVDLPVEQLLSEKPEMTKAALAKSFLKAPLETSVNAYLVNTGSKLVLIDAGAGSLFGPTLGKLTQNLRASGYEPDQVDEIYLTHMHPDHVGGMVSAGALAFPNAIVRSDQADADLWLSQTELEKAPEGGKGFFQGAMASLNPYVDAQKYRSFKGKASLIPGITAIPAYGHTPGHTTYLIESQGQKLMVVGDLIHVIAVQLDKPAITIAFDTDPKAAMTVRNQVFTQAAKNGTLIGAAHIQFPGLGHMRAAGKSYQWVPVNYTQMR